MNDYRQETVVSWKNYLTVRHGEGERFLLRRRPVPAIDLSYGDPRLAAIRSAAAEGRAGAWPVIRERLAAAEDGEDLTFLVEGLQSVPGLERWIGEVAAADPGDPLPLLVSGARHVRWAWQSRSPYEVPNASGEQLRLFRARLEQAERHLAEVAGREPSWAAPWYFLQISGRGLQVEPAEAERRFEATRTRAPGHAAAYRQQARRLGPRWGGSSPGMHAFAREAMLAAPEGSALGELVALAHLEQWLDIGADPESAYLGSPEVLSALHEAAERSVFHPGFARCRDWALPVNAFAMAFALAGDHRAARPLFRILGDRATELPWLHLDARSPLLPFLTWRARVTG